jgi:hypothetical protein
MAMSNIESLKKEYPIGNKLSGWFFRIKEVSACCYVAEGRDVVGRTVSRQGLEPEKLLEQIVKDARELSGK